MYSEPLVVHIRVRVYSLVLRSGILSTWHTKARRPGTDDDLLTFFISSHYGFSIPFLKAVLLAIATYCWRLSVILAVGAR